MVIQENRWNNRISFAFAIQLFCLLIMGIVEFLNMTKGCLLPVNLNLLTNAGIVMSILGLWAITLWKMPRSLLQRDVILGIVMVLWFLALEMNRRINYIPMQSLTIFAVVYLVALPFAAMTQDQDRQAGIRLVAGFYIAAALLLLILTLLLLAGFNLPEVLRDQVYWDGARLLVFHHPNISSRIFMIAIALCMGFLGQTRNIWVKVLMLLATPLLFGAAALTNCRAVIFATCFILAGNVFFLIYRNSRKCFLPGVIAAVVAAVVLVSVSNGLFQWNSSRLTDLYSIQTVQEQAVVLADSAADTETPVHEIIVPEAAPLAETPEWDPEGNGNSGQKSFLTDLPTLNGRTYLWISFLEKIWFEPAILLRGVVDTRLVWGNLHTHNAWLEALIMLGLPGFLLVLFFSWNATWSSLRLLWHKDTGLFRKNVALLTLSTMVAAMLEPCLFITYTEWSFSDFFFFLCLGYLTQWNKQIPHKKQ